MPYELIGTPRIETEYSDEYETVMVCDLKRHDGVIGDVWIVAGVPDYLRGSSNASNTQRGYEQVRIFGDSVDMWCCAPFQTPDEDGRYSTVMYEVIEACEKAAIQTHRERMNELEAR